jgi:putative hydrolase of the HAD superfamily
MIKAIVFDFGNVIAMQDKSCYEKMSALAGVPIEEIRSFFWKQREAYDRGDMLGAEMYSHAFREAGYPEKADDEELCRALVLLDIGSWIHYDRAVIEWTRQLKQEGYLLGVLSNMPWDFLNVHEKDIPLFTEADTAVFSCRVGLIKPGADIYQVILERLGTAPEETVFFDDLEANIAAACRLGIKGILWTGFEQARVELERIAEREGDS